MDPVDDLIEFLRFQSVSADRAYRAHVIECANWLEARFRKMGLSVRRFSTPGNPVVVACNERKPGRKTLLIYGHYDVQPPDPLDLWHTPPFEPAIRDGNLFARGSADDKGQMYMHIKAIETLRTLHSGRLPLNVKFLIEGEEEVGGVSIAKYIAANAAKLKADVA